MPLKPQVGLDPHAGHQRPIAKNAVGSHRWKVKVPPAMASGIAGLQRATQRLDRAASATAMPVDKVTLSGGGLDVAPVVESLSASHAFRASLKVIQSSDQMSNDLLELLTRR